MNWDTDVSTILYGLGAVLGVASILYFGWEILLELSPTIKSFILFSGFIFFLVAGVYRGYERLDTVLYVLSAGSYIVFLGYTIFRFALSTNQIFLTLALSSVLFLGLGYVFQIDRELLTRQQAQYLLIAVVAIVFLLVVVDVLGPQPTTEETFQDQVNVSAGAVELGTVTVRNGFVFSRTAETPRYQACLYAPDMNTTARTHVSVDDRRSRSMLLGGGEAREFTVTARFPAAPADEEERVEDRNDVFTEQELQELGTVPVEIADSCQETGDEATLTVWQGDGTRPPIAVARD